MHVRNRTLLLIALAVLAAGPLGDAWAGSSGTPYAFLVGCAQYKPSEFRALPYTGNDVEKFRQALLHTGFRSDNIVVLHDGRSETRYRPLKSHILKELNLLLDGMRPD